jgi:hypothetical protein
MCQNCEAPLDQVFTPEQQDAVRAILEQMDPHTIQQLANAAATSDTAEGFVNSIMVGTCPKCGGSNTQDCEADPEIESNLVARCLDCGTYWCVSCDSLLDKDDLNCPCWNEEIDI